MERLESEHLDEDVLLQAEHRHRYMWASEYAHGDVCDLACGYGYGAEILTANKNVESYVGIDISAEAISQANQRFSMDKRRYILGSAINIPLLDQSIDTIISLETLEHINEPSVALTEFKRILKPDGILVGSVPSKYFDDRAEEVYGKNPYHVTRFTQEYLTDLLGEYFNTIRVYYSALEVVTHIGSLENGHPKRIESAAVIRNQPDDEVSGSFHFVATNCSWLDIDAIHQNTISFCIGLTDLDSVKLIPLRKLVEQNEQLVVLKDRLIKQMEESIIQRDQVIASIPRVFRWIGKVFRKFS